MLLTLNVVTIRNNINATFGGAIIQSQTAEVPCFDVENYGEGVYRDRICVDNGKAHCKFENHHYTSHIGSCTFSGPIVE